MLTTTVLADPDALEELAAFVPGLEAELAATPPTETLPVEVVRAARAAGRGPMPASPVREDAEVLRVPRRDGGELGLRVLRPEGDVPVRGAFLHLHGGGWTLGTAAEQDERLTAIATGTGLVAVSVDYRLAPEHPFPAAPDDCEDAARWLLDGGAEALGIPPTFAIGGESAGGHLSALVLQRLGEEARRFCAADLVFGAFDLGQTPSQRLWGERRLILSGPLLDFFGACALPGTSLEERRAPELSPLFGPLDAFPPSLLTVGTLDPLVDDSLLFARALADAGREAELHLLPGAFHAYSTWRDLRASQLAEAREVAFLAERVAAAA